ncbi:MAG: signal peptidase II [Aggregatilineales bacterium]
MSVKLKRWLILLGTIVSVLLSDQLSKLWVIDNLLLGESIQPLPFLTPYFQITRSFNTGAAFGFLPEVGDIFIVIAFVVVIGIFFFYPRIPDEAVLTRLATGMVAGGALGNAVDRIIHGHVVDFIHYQIPNVISNVSNIADHAIVGGVLLIIYESWRLEKRQQALALEEPTVSETVDIDNSRATNETHHPTGQD